MIDWSQNLTEAEGAHGCLFYVIGLIVAGFILFLALYPLWLLFRS